MKNNLTAKDRGLIKGALRRVFSRSQLRRDALAKAIIQHSDSTRPRVTKWGRCTECKEPTALYQLEIDHREPLIPLGLTLADLSWDTIITRLWCDISNLDPLCKDCHKRKSKAEAKQRRIFKKEKADNENSKK